MSGSAEVVIKVQRQYTGWLLFKQGFRPFFLAASLWAVVSMFIAVAHWLLPLHLQLALPPLQWHQHELLFGYVGAALAGFLLTASANWTSRPALSGSGLIAMVLLWVLARLTMLLPAGVLAPQWTIIAVLTFPVVLITFVTRELLMARHHRNLRLIAVVLIYALANVLFLVEVFRTGVSVAGGRLALSALLILLMLIGGRVVPSFTGNWLRKLSSAETPAAFGHLDGVTLMVSSATLFAWTFSPPSSALATALLVAGVLNIWRLLRWYGHRTLAEPLVWILHLAYLFIALGFIVVGVSMWYPPVVPGSAGVHVWTIGAVSLMCMAVMTRASLGHMSQPLQADRLILAMYVLLMGCLLARVVANYGLVVQMALLVSAVFWCLAHAAFVWRYAHSFLTQR